jgi:hypothetical protein|tara:strand:+ start:609 stop:725 length:117 start_codon:yes stop_codon:yes gene_type:complete
MLSFPAVFAQGKNVPVSISNPGDDISSVVASDQLLALT